MALKIVKENQAGNGSVSHLGPVSKSGDPPETRKDLTNDNVCYKLLHGHKRNGVFMSNLVSLVRERTFLQGPFKGLTVKDVIPRTDRKIAQDLVSQGIHQVSTIGGDKVIDVYTNMVN
jgi:hypothetical protein